MNGLDKFADVVIANGRIEAIEHDSTPRKGDATIDASDLIVMPGIIDAHLHIHDLFEISTRPTTESVTEGVTSAITPGAGNTLMAPSLIGAEIDRGLPLNVGCAIGAAATLAPRATIEEKIRFFKGEMSEEESKRVISRNTITNRTAPLAIGIKDHMGHFILSDGDLEDCFELTSEATLFFMSHTESPEHAERVVDLSHGRPVHLSHATAAGAGIDSDSGKSMERVIDLIKENKNVSGEFVTSHLRPSRGNRDGIRISSQAQEIAIEALRKGYVKILVSDGQAEATMKGFGDTRDNVPSILELAEKNVLPLSESISLMTANPARLLSERTGSRLWLKDIGNLSIGSRANVTMANPAEKEVLATFVNGRLVAFEGRLVRSGYGAGGMLTRKGILEKTCVGDEPIFRYNS